jgi:hypothetical protein
MASSWLTAAADTIPLLGGREQVAPRIGFVGRAAAYFVRLPGVRQVLGCFLNAFGWCVDVAGDEVGGETDEMLNAIGDGFKAAGRIISSSGTSSNSSEPVEDDDEEEEEEIETLEKTEEVSDREEDKKKND